MLLSIKPTTGLYLFLFTAPLSVCSILFGKLDWMILIMSTFMVCPFIKFSSIKPSVGLQWIFKLFYLPFVLSACWSLALIIIVNRYEYNSFISSAYIFRLLHVGLFIIILLYADKYIRTNYTTDSERLLKIIAWGIIICLGVFGLWQILGNIFGIWTPKIETRGDLYSARALGISRVTSIADEPSYLAPFIIDAVLVLLYLRKKLVALVMCGILVFSLSFGGLSEAIILISAYILFSSTTTKIKVILGFIIAIIIFCMAFPDVVELILQIVQSRQELQSGFDVSQTSRTAMIIFPIEKWSEFDVISLFLGYGPGSSKFLMEANPGEAMFSTSNNIYADLLYEEGLIGVTCYVALMVLFYNRFGRLAPRDRIFARLLILHIMISSLYRADYSSARYTLLFVILLFFYKLIDTKEDCNTQWLQRRQ